MTEMEVGAVWGSDGGWRSMNKRGIINGDSKAWKTRSVQARSMGSSIKCVLLGEMSLEGTSLLYVNCVMERVGSEKYDYISIIK